MDLSNVWSCTGCVFLLEVFYLKQASVVLGVLLETERQAFIESTAKVIKVYHCSLMCVMERQKK